MDLELAIDFSHIDLPPSLECLRTVYFSPAARVILIKIHYNSDHVTPVLKITQ